VKVKSPCIGEEKRKRKYKKKIDIGQKKATLHFPLQVIENWLGRTSPLLSTTCPDPIVAVDKVKAMRNSLR